MSGLLYGLFFLSGGSALIYELIWQRCLNLVFGVSTLAVSGVLAAFMGGLALGGLLFGRRADRSARPLRLYAGLEAGIAVSALLVPAGFAALTQVYTAACCWLQPGPWLGTGLRLALALLVLLVPATLIGGTLPVMGRLAARRGSGLACSFSLLYGINTLGAVLGAVLTGFVLLRCLGMRQTLWLAAGINFLAAVGAALGDRFSSLEVPATPHADSVEASSAPSSFWRWPAAACAGVTGAGALGFEVAWTRILGIYTSNSAFAFALVLGVMLLGLGLGSLVQALWARRPGDSGRRLALCQGFLAALILGSLPYFRTAPAWLGQWCDGTSALRIFLAELTLTAAALFLPAVLMGMTFPLLAAPFKSGGQPVGRWLGRVYAVNTLGGVLGAFLTGFVVIPTLGLQRALGGIALLNVGVGVAGLLASSRLRWTVRCVAAGLAGLAAVVVVLRLPAGGYTKAAVVAPRQLLAYREGNNGTVSVVREANGTRSIMVDGQPVAGTAPTSVIDQKMLAHLPLLLHPDPRRALTVGFGSGGTSHSMTLHGVAVDCVEIERAVPAAADLFVSENHGVLGHPHFRLVIDDARNWLRVSPDPYDVVVTDCTNIQYKSNGDLYTVEYFRLMKDRLTAHGVAAAWVPANGIDPADLKTLLRSFRAVFPHTSVWYMNTLPTDFLIVVGTPDRLDLDLEELHQRMVRPGVREDLEAVGLEDPYRLACTFLTADEDLAAYLEAGPLNRDDRPVLSYSTYGATFRATIVPNLVELLACRSDVTEYVSRGGDRTTLRAHYAASNEVLLGHVTFLAGHADAARAHYEKGIRLIGADPYLIYLAATSSRRCHPSEKR